MHILMDLQYFSDISATGRLYQSGGSEGREKILSELDKTDTQSSIASFGRVSLPDSLEARFADGPDTADRNPNSSIPDQNSYQSSEMGRESNYQSVEVGRENNYQSIGVGGESNYQSIGMGGESNYQSIGIGGDLDGTELFHPSEDNFFKVANPVSEKLDIFNSMEGVGAIGDDSSSIKSRKNLDMEADLENLIQRTSDINLHNSTGVSTNIQRSSQTDDGAHALLTLDAKHSAKSQSLLTSAIVNGDSESISNNSFSSGTDDGRTDPILS